MVLTLIYSASSLVILSDYYDLPFNDILDWRKFSVVLKETDVYHLKQILKNISDDQFLQLHYNLVKVRSPFLYMLRAAKNIILCTALFTLVLSTQ